MPTIGHTPAIRTRSLDEARMLLGKCLELGHFISESLLLVDGRSTKQASVSVGIRPKGILRSRSLAGEYVPAVLDPDVLDV